jgi:hypothetical protein
MHPVISQSKYYPANANPNSSRSSSFCGVNNVLTSEKHCHNIMTEKVIRDFCGNRFHPGLIDAALGTDEQFQTWAAKTINAQVCHKPVPPIKETHQNYLPLLRLVLEQGHKRGVKLLILLDQETPQRICLCTRTAKLPKVSMAMLCNTKLTASTCMY